MLSDTLISAAYFESAVLFARGEKIFAGALDMARRSRALPDEGLQQFALAVACNTCHANDLAFAHIETQAVDGHMATVAVDDELVHAHAHGAREAVAAFWRDELALGLVRAAHHVGGELLRNDVDHRVRCDKTPTPQHAHVVGIGHDLAELVRDEHDAALARMRATAQQTEHVVGLLRREHRSRLVENQEPRLEQQLLEDFELLLLACRQLLRCRVEVEVKRRGGNERAQLGAHRRPVDDRRQFAAREQQVLRHRHAGNEREVLVDHADAEIARDGWRRDVALAPVDEHRAFFGALIAYDAFDERAFAGAVFAEQCMHAAGCDLE